MTPGNPPPDDPRWRAETRSYSGAPGSGPPDPGADDGPARPPEGNGLLQVGPYRLIARAGAGGMGVVWRAQDPRLARPVALKLLRSEEAGSPEARARLLREARLAARLRHPGIVVVRDCGEADGRIYLVMDWVEGATWAQRLEQRVFPLDPDSLREEVTRLAAVADAVAHAHRAGILHRDLKPGNVLLDGDGRPQVADFGLAKGPQEGPGVALPLTSAHDVLGTPAFMSPEQAQGTVGLGPATDVWSLGCILYLLLTGETPFGGAGGSNEVLRATVEEQAEAPSLRVPGTPRELEVVCRYALERDVRSRCPSAADFAADLRRWLAGEPVRATGGPVRRALRQVARLRRTLAALALGLLLALGMTWSTRAARARALEHLAQAEQLVLRLDEVRLSGDFSPEAARSLAEQTEALTGAALSDAPDLGEAYALRGYLRHLLGREAEAEADLDQGCALAGKRAVPFLLRGAMRSERYRRLRGRPQSFYGATGLQFDSVRPELPAEKALRERSLDDLKRALAAADPGIRAEEVRVAEATVDYFDGTPEALTRALAHLAEAQGRRATLLRADVLYRCRRFEEALPILDRLAAALPADTETRLGAAYTRFALAIECAASGGDPRTWLRSALADADAVLASDPTGAMARFCRAESLALLGDAERERGEDARHTYAQAIAEYDTLAAGAPDDLRIRLQRAIALSRATEMGFERGEDASALQARARAELDEVLRLRPDFAEARNVRGVSRLDEASRRLDAGADAAELLQGAREDLDAALRLAPDMTEARANRVLWVILTCVQEQRAGGADPRPRLDRALAEIGELLAAHPQYPAALVGRAALLRARGEAEADLGGDPRGFLRDACADYQAALQRQPGLQDAQYGLGAVLTHLAEAEAASPGDSERVCLRAIEVLDGVIAHSPGRLAARSCGSKARLLLALARRKMGADVGDLVRSCLAELDDLRTLRPDDLSTLQDRGLARALLARNQRDHGVDPTATSLSAVSDLRAAAAAGSHSAKVNLAILLLDLQKPEDAIPVLESVSPDDAGEFRKARTLLDSARALARQATQRPWISNLEAAGRMIRAGHYPLARIWLERLLAAAEGVTPPTPEAVTDLVHAHYNLACVLTVLSNGRDSPSASPREIAPAERDPLRESALDHLSRAIDLGWRDAALTDGDADLVPLRDHPRWSEVRARLDR